VNGHCLFSDMFVLMVFNQEKRELRERLELSEKQLMTQQSEVETQALIEVDEQRE
jgi:hypothetical protein